MGVGTLLRYLIGDRAAILQIASNRHALWIGLLFVLSAGLAREYDGEDLLREPWYLALPLGASLLSSLLLFSVAYGVAVLKGESPGAFPSRYAAFLGLFWLTAPLAWLYAIPYERFCTPVQAVSLNLLTLGVVSVWRVALMTRVMMVLLGYSLGAALCLVLVFADAVVLTLLNFLPFPLIDVMGGLRLSESQRLVRAVAVNVGCVGCLSLPLWVVGTLALVAKSKAAWQAAPADGKPRLGLAGLAVASVLIWLPLLPLTQPEQQRRRIVETLFQQGERAWAVRFMSRYPREAFPPHWAPPRPRIGSLYGLRDFVEFLDELPELEAAPWVREAYFEVVRDALRGEMFVDPQQWRQLGKVLEKTTEGRAILQEMKSDPAIDRLLRGERDPAGVPDR